MKTIKKIITYLFSASLLVLVAVVAFWIGFRLVAPSGRRVIETSRMETCLEIYREYMIDRDRKVLIDRLEEINLTPREFEAIIDRFIYYRSRKSSKEHALRLLRAFRMGLDIEDAQVYSITGVSSEPFALDAEILSVFEKDPELVNRAFGG